MKNLERIFDTIEMLSFILIALVIVIRCFI